MPRKKEEEEYCEYCGKLLEDCECDEDEYEDDITLDDVNKGLDTLKKGLDVIDKFQKITTPKSIQPTPLSNNEAKWISQDIVRKPQIAEKEKNEKIEEDKKKHKKWVIETIAKIAVPIIVALIGVGFFLLKH